MKDNNIKITLIICSTIMVIFFSYHFFLSDYSRCVNAVKNSPAWGQTEIKVKDTEGGINAAKVKCSQK